MKPPWKKISSKVVYSNRWCKIKEDKVIKPDGKEGTYSVLETRAPSVFVVALTDNKEIYLINQYRYPVKKFSWEIPGGGSDKENLLKAAKRELLEEAGLTARYWKQIGMFNPMNGICSEDMYIFIAKDLEQTNENKQQEEGINTLKKIPFKNALKMIKSGKITDSQSSLAILQAGLYLGYIS